MIPLRDTQPSERFPVVNWLLIIINALVFIFELTLGDTEAETFFYKFGLVPSQTNLTSGNQYTFFTNELCTIFHTNACSLPPLPITRIFIICTPYI